MLLWVLRIPEVQSGNDNQIYNATENASFDTECYIICEAVCRTACVKLEYGIRKYISTVWQAKEDVLGKIPCGMNGKCAPQAVPVIDNHGAKDSHQHETENRPDGNTIIHQVH